MKQSTQKVMSINFRRINTGRGVRIIQVKCPGLFT